MAVRDLRRRHVLRVLQQVEVARQVHEPAVRLRREADLELRRVHVLARHQVAHRRDHHRTGDGEVRAARGARTAHVAHQVLVALQREGELALLVAGHREAERHRRQHLDRAHHAGRRRLDVGRLQLRARLVEGAGDLDGVQHRLLLRAAQRRLGRHVVVVQRDRVGAQVPVVVQVARAVLLHVQAERALRHLLRGARQRHAHHRVAHQHRRGHFHVHAQALRVLQHEALLRNARQRVRQCHRHLHARHLRTERRLARRQRHRGRAGVDVEGAREVLRRHARHLQHGAAVDRHVHRALLVQRAPGVVAVRALHLLARHLAVRHGVVLEEHAHVVRGLLRAELQHVSEADGHVEVLLLLALQRQVELGHRRLAVEGRVEHHRAVGQRQRVRAHHRRDVDRHVLVALLGERLEVLERDRERLRDAALLAHHAARLLDARDVAVVLERRREDVLVVLTQPHVVDVHLELRLHLVRVLRHHHADLRTLVQRQRRQRVRRRVRVARLVEEAALRHEEDHVGAVHGQRLEGVPAGVLAHRLDAHARLLHRHADRLAREGRALLRQHVAHVDGVPVQPVRGRGQRHRRHRRVQLERQRQVQHRLLRQRLVAERVAQQHARHHANLHHRLLLAVVQRVLDHGALVLYGVRQQLHEAAVARHQEVRRVVVHQLLVEEDGHHGVRVPEVVARQLRLRLLRRLQEARVAHRRAEVELHRSLHAGVAVAVAVAHGALHHLVRAQSVHDRHGDHRAERAVRAEAQARAARAEHQRLRGAQAARVGRQRRGEHRLVHRLARHRCPGQLHVRQHVHRRVGVVPAQARARHGALLALREQAAGQRQRVEALRAGAVQAVAGAHGHRAVEGQRGHALREARQHRRVLAQPRRALVERPVGAHGQHGLHRARLVGLHHREVRALHQQLRHRRVARRHARRRHGLRALRALGDAEALGQLQAVRALRLAEGELGRVRLLLHQDGGGHGRRVPLMAGDGGLDRHRLQQLLRVEVQREARLAVHHEGGDEALALEGVGGRRVRRVRERALLQLQAHLALARRARRRHVGDEVDHRHGDGQRLALEGHRDLREVPAEGVRRAEGEAHRHVVTHQRLVGEVHGALHVGHGGRQREAVLLAGLPVAAVDDLLDHVVVRVGERRELVLVDAHVVHTARHGTRLQAQRDAVARQLVGQHRVLRRDLLVGRVARRPLAGGPVHTEDEADVVGVVARRLVLVVRRVDEQVVLEVQQEAVLLVLEGVVDAHLARDLAAQRLRHLLVAPLLHRARLHVRLRAPADAAVRAVVHEEPERADVHPALVREEHAVPRVHLTQRHEVELRRVVRVHAGDQDVARHEVRVVRELELRRVELHVERALAAHLRRVEGHRVVVDRLRQHRHRHVRARARGAQLHQVVRREGLGEVAGRHQHLVRRLERQREQLVAHRVHALAQARGVVALQAQHQHLARDDEHRVRLRLDRRARRRRHLLRVHVHVHQAVVAADAHLRVNLREQTHRVHVHAHVARFHRRAALHAQRGLARVLALHRRREAHVHARAARLALLESRRVAGHRLLHHHHFTRRGVRRHLARVRHVAHKLQRRGSARVHEARRQRRHLVHRRHRHHVRVDAAEGRRVDLAAVLEEGRHVHLELSVAHEQRAARGPQFDGLARGQHHLHLHRHVLLHVALRAPVGADHALLHAEGARADRRRIVHVNRHKVGVNGARHLEDRHAGGEHGNRVDRLHLLENRLAAGNAHDCIVRSHRHLLDHGSDDHVGTDEIVYASPARPNAHRGQTHGTPQTAPRRP